MSALVHPRTVFVAFSLLFSACAPLDDAQDTAVQEVSGRPVCQYVRGGAEPGDPAGAVLSRLPRSLAF